MNQKITPLKQLLFRGLFLISLMSLVSCANNPSPQLSITSVSIYTTPDTNENSATAVDLVLIYDPQLLQTLGHMTAAKYFSMTNQLLLDNPTLLDVWHWELVPGQTVQNFLPPQDKGEMFGAYVFANYFSTGDHRIKVNPNGIVKILLLRKNMKNLATTETPDLRKGKTSSDIPCNETGRDGDLYKLEKGPTMADIPYHGPSYRLGPTKTLAEPCKKRATNFNQKHDSQRSRCFKDHPKQPIPIVARSLLPLASTSVSK